MVQAEQSGTRASRWEEQAEKEGRQRRRALGDVAGSRTGVVGRWQDVAGSREASPEVEKASSGVEKASSGVEKTSNGRREASSDVGQRRKAGLGVD